MEAAEIEILIDELETRVDRLRALYEQYFMGIEKIEPLIQRKDIERRIYVLRRVQIRNTALRFRFNNTIQRLNTMQQYWARIVREIENGTYKRDVRRAAARFGADAITGAARKRLGKLIDQVEAERSRDPEFEVDVEMDEFSDDLSEDVQGDKAGRPAAPARAIHGGFGEFGDDDFHSPDFGDGEGFGSADVGFGSLPDDLDQPPRKAALGHVTTSNPALAAFFEPEEYDASEWGEAPKKTASRPTTPVPPPPAAVLVAPKTDPAPPPTDPPDARPIGTRPSGGLLSSLGTVRRAPVRPLSDPGPSPSAPPAAASPLPKAGAGLLGTLSRPPSPRIQSPVISSASGPLNPPVTPTAPKPSAPGSPIRPSGAPAARPQVAASPAPAPSQPTASAGSPGARPLAAGQAPARTSSPQPTASRVAVTASQPKPPGANGADGHGLSNDRVRKIYESYVQARRACRESTSNITEGKLEEMLKQSATKLRGKHGGKNIDFDVVIKDGKAVLKPVVKG